MGDKQAREGPVGQAYKRVADSLRGPGIDGAQVDLVFDIPGSMHRPSYEGIKVAPVRRGTRSVQVWMAVPERLDESQIDQTLLDLASRALTAALERLSRAGIDTSPDAGTLVVKSARDKLGLASASAMVDRDQQIVDDSDLDDVIEAEVSLVGVRAPDERVHLLLKAGEVIDERLRALGLGEVEGNEVGSDSVVLFVRRVRADHDEVMALLRKVLPSKDTTYRTR